jgi:DNA-binding response OmpR family regulator
VLQGQRYDVILCDLRMSELDGRAFYAHLRYRAPTLCRRVIFLTGDSRAVDHQAFLAQCGRPWLDKPYTIAGLRRLIQQVLERAAGAQQLSPPCQDLRQLSQGLRGTAQTLRAQSRHWRRQSARLRGLRSPGNPGGTAGCSGWMPPSRAASGAWVRDPWRRAVEILTPISAPRHP